VRPWRRWRGGLRYAADGMGTGLVPRYATLVTNDDGIDSPGLAVLAAAAVRVGLDVVVAAPARQSSGASAGIIATTREGRPLIERRQLPDLPDVEAYAVQAQPGYIVRAAVRGWLDPVPQLVVSGINHGANVGRAILHSGTVGAALTAGVNGVRGLAVSLDVGLYPAQPPYWDTAAHLFPDVLEILIAAPAGTVLSLNVPDRSIVALRELRPAALAEFGTVQTRVDRAENGELHLAQVEVDAPPDPGTDSALLAAGHPTLTALESVSEASSPALSQWLVPAGKPNA
jgi:5'-nucleotidase